MKKLGGILKNKEIMNRILFTVLILFIFRIGAQITVPGVTLGEDLQNYLDSSYALSLMNLLGGGTLQSFSIFALGVSPYITAQIIVELLSTDVLPALTELKRQGQGGRRKLEMATRYLTLMLGAVQAYGIIRTMESSDAITFVTASQEWLTYIYIIVIMMAGSMIVMWLGDQISVKGIGNGISMIIFASIISQLPTTLASLGTNLFDTTNGSLDLFGWIQLPVNPVVFWIIVCFTIAMLAVIFFLVKLNEAQRVITINYAKRVHGNTSYGGIKSILPIKLIAAGVIPVIFATAFLSLPALVGQVITSINPENTLGSTLTTMFTAPSASNFQTLYPDGITAQWFLYPAVYFVLVIMFTYFYTSIIFNTNEIADNLQKQGGFIEGVRPGVTTAKYLGKVVNRLNLFGALALGLVAMLPFITDYLFIVFIGYPIGLSISGTGLLIVVTVALENLRSLDSRALMVTYDDFSNEPEA